MSRLNDAIDKLVSLGTSGRPVLLKLDDGSGRIFMFNDAAKTYVEQERFNARRRSVSNIASFAAMVKAEILRYRSAQPTNEDQPSAAWPTVVFTDNGGSFHLDDSDDRITFGYARKLAPGFASVSQLVGKPMDHLSLVRCLQGLRSYIVDEPGTPAGTLISTFRKVTFERGVRVDSQPLVVDNNGHAAYEMNFSARGGPMQTFLPTTIPLVLPYARGGNRYPTELEVDVTLKDAPAGSTGGASLVFTLAWPLQPDFVETAIEDEIGEFRAEVSGLINDGPGSLVILENL